MPALSIVAIVADHPCPAQYMHPDRPCPHQFADTGVGGRPAGMNIVDQDDRTTGDRVGIDNAKGAANRPCPGSRTHFA